ncbi:MAG: hypothetical protein JST55_02160 [Bacteroidetes bacterium]|nr:hypothetical protein [Bacteroidota bacterium]
MQNPQDLALPKYSFLEILSFNFKNLVNNFDGMAKPTREELEIYIVSNREKYNQLAEFYSRYNPEYYHEVFRGVENKYIKKTEKTGKAGGATTERTRIGPFLLFIVIIAGCAAGYFYFFGEKKDSVVLDHSTTVSTPIETPDIVDSRKQYEAWQEDFIERSRSRSKNIVTVKPENNSVYIYGQTITRDLDNVAKTCVKDYYSSTKENWGEFDVTGYLYVGDKLVKTYTATSKGVYSR